MKAPKRFPLSVNGRFANFKDERHESVFLRSLVMFVQSWCLRRKKTVDVVSWLENRDTDFLLPTRFIQWIGHASFLIKINELTIITDPVFGDLSFLFKRILPAHYSFDSVPFVDIILISHNHRDHMDAASLHALRLKNPKLKVLVPYGDNYWFTSRGYNVQEYIWWESTVFANHATTITFLPAIHWSQRGLFDRNRSLWGSWMIQHQESTIYFAGDTAYGSHFEEIAGHFDVINYALMPIGPCDPHHWMKVSHMNAEEAVEAFLQIKADFFIPMHWGAYWFGIDEFITPIERLLSYWKKSQLKQEQLHVLKVGQIADAQKPPLFIPATDTPVVHSEK